MYKYVTSFPKNMHLFLKNRAILGIKRAAGQPTDCSHYDKIHSRYHPSGQGYDLSPIVLTWRITIYAAPSSVKVGLKHALPIDA